MMKLAPGDGYVAALIRPHQMPRHHQVLVSERQLNQAECEVASLSESVVGDDRTKPAVVLSL